MDGTCVSKRSGRHSREWMNNFPWRRRKSNEYEICATKDGIEVCLEGKTIWGVAAADSK